MQVQFNQTEDDIVAFNLFHRKHSPAVRRLRWILMLCVLYLGVACCFLFGLPLWVGALWAVLFILFFRVLVAFPKKHISRMVREGRNLAKLGLRTITISPEGVTEKTPVSETHYQWLSIERIGTTDDYAFLYTSALSSFIVPKRAFSDPSEFVAFISEARQYADMAKQSIAVSSGGTI